ncbi:lipopolysaccharide biosynthesis protein [Marinobacter caseinilyticus]|uniref:lipopolysaccharide biosynthesis protein n=1 Tax=Marinobacter caseinilyticus TaxID=2692195 RepID=UPI00140AB76E|nr:lipopolysaccharide biosynthesis protein [Marinobacter caseinilyticus]
MSASQKVIKSSALLLALQLVQRGLGIASTLILARLLTPEHFGIVALVMIALQFFELLVETGNQQYIVQKDDVDDHDLNTAWSMDVLIKTTMAILIMVSAPSIAGYFQTPELTLALSVAALTLPIRALKTPGMMLLAREINYRPGFRLALWQKVLSFVTVIIIALIQPSHWAIITGTLVSSIVLAIGSYRVHSFRPRWSLTRISDQWSFSQWLVLRGIVGFTRSQIDNLMVSRFFGTVQLGGYNLVREVSLLPALSAIIPMSEPLLAAIAQSKYDKPVLAYRIRLSLALMATILMPLTTFLMLYPELITAVLLGPQWSEYAPLLRPFGLFFLTFCLFALVSDAMIALGRVKALFTFDVISTALIIIALLTLATDSLSNMAWYRGWLAVVTTFGLIVILNRLAPFNLLRLLWLCTPSFAASLGAAWLLTQLTFSTLPNLLEFLIRGCLFVLFAVVLTWGFSSALLARSEEWKQLKSLTASLKGNNDLSQDQA